MRTAAWLLLVLFVFSIPWEYSLDLGEPWGNIARIAGVTLLLVAIPCVLQAGRIRALGPLQCLALALYAWMSCTTLWSIDRAASLDHIRGMFQVMLVVWMTWEFVESPRDLRWMMRAYVAGAWVLAVLSLASFASPQAADQVRFVAEGQDPNDAARFLALALPMAALLWDTETSWSMRLVSLGFLPLGFLCILLTASREGFLAALIALIGSACLLFRRSSGRLIFAFLSIPVVAAAIWITVPQATLERLATIPAQLQSGDLNQRLNIWAAGWQAFVRAPFFGSGAGSFVTAAGLAPIDTAHNTLLSLGVEGGIVAILLSIAIVIVSIYAAKRTIGPLCIGMITVLAAWCITTFAATVEQNRSTWFLLGLIACAGRLSQEQPQALTQCFSAREDRAIASTVASLAG